MINERIVATSAKTLLMSRDPIKIAHLIKFERPYRPDSTYGVASTSANRYAYLTDASFPISFDDGSVALNNTSNGAQIYYPAKIKNIGTVTEASEATTASTSITLDGTAIGTIIQSMDASISLVSGTTYSISFSEVDWSIVLDYPIREGDKVLLNSVPVIIKSFGTNSLYVDKLDISVSTGTGPINIELASEELLSILLDKNSSEYASFVNREVSIFRLYADDSGQIAGNPILLFKGIISGASFDDTDSGIDITWSLTNQWGDFSQVKGRLTSDAAHRALDANGAPQINSALKPIYAYDKGFSHSDTAINVTANYTTLQQVVRTEKRKTWFGLVKYKTFTDYKTITNDSKLSINLSSEYLPVVYGVRAVEGKPIFADVLNSNSSIVYVAYSLCEGEIGGIYDIYIDGNSLICADKADYDARSSTGATDTSNVSSFCYGRGDRGDVLSGSIATNATITNGYTNSNSDLIYSSSRLGNSRVASINYLTETNIFGYDEPVVGSGTISSNPLDGQSTAYTTAHGLIHGTSLSITSPQDITIDVYAGTPSQKASPSLSNIAYTTGFKIQNSYWKAADTYEYWGPNHRLLDTAYAVAKFTLTEKATGIPSLEFLIKGKSIRCYNYDGSYKHDSRSSTESHANFALGDIVDVYDMSNNLLNSSIRIIDKWVTQAPDGAKDIRFRFSTTPELNYIDGIPGIKKFYMKKGTNTWTMVTYNHIEALGVIPSAIKTSITAANTVSGAIQFVYNSLSDITINGDTLESSAGLGVVDSNGFAANSALQPFKYGILRGTVTSTSIQTKYPSSQILSAQSSVGLYMASYTTIRLPASFNPSDNFYSGYIITVKRFNSVTGKLLVQTGEIIGYNGSTRIATINTIWSFIPDAGDTVEIVQKYIDDRISINPAMQTLDYLTSSTYGRGFSVDRDIVLLSFIEAAQKCDTQSDVTIKTTSNLSTIDIGDVFQYPSSGPIKFMGTVDSINGSYITLTNVVGKLTNKWNSWRFYDVDDLVYSNDILYVVTSAGIKTSEPTHASGTINGLLAISGATLYNAINASITITTIGDGNPIRAVLNNNVISGYSIYDSDSIDYWRHIGWDEPKQRYVTLYQTNIVLDTSVSVFDNINALLSHYNGILRNSEGRWSLSVESKEGAILSSDVRFIDESDIIGKIELSDDGIKSSYNIVSASFADPSNKFNDRSISFYNSAYQLADKNVQKKGSISVSGITNYYNTRLLADSFIHKSRFGLTINLTIDYSGILLLAGTVIAVSVPKYKWSPKKFRIQSISYRYDGLVDIIAREYDDSIYGATYLTKLVGTSGISTGSGSGTLPTSIMPYSIAVSSDKYGYCIVDWVNPPDAINLGCKTEIWRAETNDINSATYLGYVEPGIHQYKDSIPNAVNDGAGSDVKYYWLRYRID